MGTMYHIIAFHSRNSVCALINNRPLARETLFNLILYLNIFNMSWLISLLSLLDFLFLPLLISFSFIPSFLPPLFFYPLFPEVTLLPIFFKYIFQAKRTQFFSVNRLCVRDQGSLQEKGEDGNHRSFAGARNALECERGYIQRIIFLLWK